MSASARRTFLTTTLSGLGLLAAPSASQAQGRVPARADSPRTGADPLLISTGLTGRWQSAMRKDLGWTARFEAMGTRCEITRYAEVDEEERTARTTAGNLAEGNGVEQRSLHGRATHDHVVGVSLT